MARTRFIDTVSQEEIDATMAKKTTQLNDRELKIYRAVKADQRQGRKTEKKKVEVNTRPSSSPAPILISKPTIPQDGENEDSGDNKHRRKKKWPNWIKYPKTINAKEYIGFGVFINVNGKVEISRIRYDAKKKQPFFQVSSTGQTFPATWKVVYIAANYAFVLDPRFTADNTYSGWKE